MNLVSAVKNEVFELRVSLNDLDRDLKELSTITAKNTQYESLKIRIDQKFVYIEDVVRNINTLFMQIPGLKSEYGVVKTKYSEILKGTE